MLRAVSAGNGTQAQFNHYEFGGMGQWSQGGMIMIGDMFNQGLKYQVSMLCDELSGLLRSQPLFAPSPSQTQMQGSGVSFFVQGAGSNWWPAELGSPSSTGAQNDMRYAFFPGARRLAIQVAGQTRVYDTLDHSIGGFSQQQGGDQSLTFNSQYGLVRVADLPLVSPVAPPAPAWAPEPVFEPAPQPQAWSPEPQVFAPAPAAPVGPTSSDDIFALLEKLADLKTKGVLTDEEFAAKKTDLLSRL
jgi:hypothetical protein